MTECQIYDKIKISILTTIVMQQIVLLENHGKSKYQKQVTYFCRLCRQYGIKTRKSHLQNFHKANRDTVTKRSNNDLVDVIFIESK